MNICLYEAEAQSANVWKDLIPSFGGKLLVLPAWNPHDATQDRGADLLVLDQAAVSGSCIELAIQLAQAQPTRTVVVTGHALQVEDVVRMMSQGVAYVLEKPLSSHSVGNMLAKLHEGVRGLADRTRELHHLTELFSSLTDREKDVLNHVLEGTPNREAAELLKVSVRTIESRRAKVYRKLNAHNVAQLVRTIDRLGQLQEQLAPTATELRVSERAESVPRPHSTYRELEPSVA